MASSPDGKTALRPRFGGVLFNGYPPRAERLSWDHLREGGSTGLWFDLDGRLTSTVTVDWSGVGGQPPEDEARVLDLALMGLVAQHALPSRLDGPVPIPVSAAPRFLRLLEMLYEIRAFCDETPIPPAPCWDREPSGPARGSQPALDPNRVLVFLSGGFDSTLSALLLRDAGFEVTAVHVRTNRHVEEAEERASREVARRLGVPILVLRLEFAEQEGVGRYYSRTFGEYPFYNSIPHGRDFPLAVIGTLLARRLGCGGVAFGHEKESRHKALQYGDRKIHRHDVESSYGADLLRTFLRESLGEGVKIFSPVAGLSIHRVRELMFRRHPDLVPELQSCFWGRRCEKCLKCVSTYAIQRLLGLDLVPFTLNPFADPDDRDMALLADPDRPSASLAYGPQMHYAMVQLVTGGNVGSEDLWLHHFAATGMERVSLEWPRIHELCCQIDHPPEVPDGVRALLSRIA